MIRLFLASRSPRGLVNYKKHVKLTPKKQKLLDLDTSNPVVGDIAGYTSNTVVGATPQFDAEKKERPAKRFKGLLVERIHHCF
jgi:hypothetical protein